MESELDQKTNSSTQIGLSHLDQIMAATGDLLGTLISDVSIIEERRKEILAMRHYGPTIESLNSPLATVFDRFIANKPLGIICIGIIKRFFAVLGPMTEKNDVVT